MNCLKKSYLSLTIAVAACCSGFFLNSAQAYEKFIGSIPKHMQTVEWRTSHCKAGKKYSLQEGLFVDNKGVKGKKLSPVERAACNVWLDIDREQKEASSYSKHLYSSSLKKEYDDDVEGTSIIKEIIKSINPVKIAAMVAASIWVNLYSPVKIVYDPTRDVTNNMRSSIKELTGNLRKALEAQQLKKQQEQLELNKEYLKAVTGTSKISVYDYPVEPSLSLEENFKRFSNDFPKEPCRYCIKQLFVAKLLNEETSKFYKKFSQLVGSDLAYSGDTLAKIEQDAKSTKTWLESKDVTNRLKLLSLAYTTMLNEFEVRKSEIKAFADKPN